MSSDHKIQNIIFDHDGGIDDYVALAILCSDPTVNIVGIIIIDGDCLIEPGYEATRKTIALCNRQHIPVYKSTIKAKHDFPMEWRIAHNLTDWPVLNTPNLDERLSNYPIKDDITGEEFLCKLVLESPEPIAVVTTGPLSNIAYGIDKYGDKFIKNIDALYFMGGAVDVKGNVEFGDVSAEWNIYWDAPAAQKVFKSSIKYFIFLFLYSILRKIMFSLDSTNSVPVTSKFVRRFGHQQEYPISQFIGTILGVCTPMFEFYAWDGLTAAYVIDKSIAEIEPCTVKVICEGPSEGRTVRCEISDTEASSNTFMAVNANGEEFYALTLKSLAQHF